MTLGSDESVERGLHIQESCVGGVPNLILPSVLFGCSYCILAYNKRLLVVACCGAPC